MSAPNSPGNSVKELTIEELYQKKEQRDHALELPDTYIGSIEKHREPMWILENGEQMVQKEIEYVPGLYKIYDEILVNAIDHWTRMAENRRKQQLIQTGKMDETPEITLSMKFKPVKNIKVNINPEKSEISVYNDGNGIPVVVHKVVNCYLPEMLFSQFLTSGNYKSENVNQTKIIGGKNGYGATLTALFSKEFTIETVDAERGKKYIQTYRNNLSDIEPPTITDVPKSTIPYTKITFKPDLERFGLAELTPDVVSLFEKRVYDASAWCKGVNVYYNDTKIDIRDFNQYTNLYLGKDRTAVKRVYLEVSDRWAICATLSPDHEFQQVSMVNGILTSKGGRHVDHVADQIAKKIAENLTKGKTTVDKKVVKANLWIFVRAVIENPGFDSQTKECLNTQISKFGSKCTLSDEDIKKIGACGINQRSKDLSKFKVDQMNKNNDGKKTKKLLGMDKLVDADYAGDKKKSRKCTLVLTEGDSAKSFATEGFKSLSEEERKYWGAFPLRGKVLNVRDAKVTMIDKNAEITNLKKILGLKVGVDYSGDNIEQLRYGRVMILTDADKDGDHIKGLLINFFHHFWPSLLERNDFMVTMVTPIVKVWKERRQGLTEERYNELKFYSENEYFDWKKSNNGGRGWEIRYYKGLGSSKANEAMDAFEEMKTIQYLYEDEQEVENAKGLKVTIKPSDQAINLAFLKSNADLRKEWLLSADLKETVDYNITQESYSDFINHRLIQFSWEDTHRSIPNICDGLKPSQRKIMYYMLRWGPRKSEKVAQLAGGIAKKAAYHHGEVSLMDTMIGLAQNYVGTSNINLLYPDGNFGTKLAKGKDAGAPRYIYTKNESIVNYLYKKEDMGLYDYLDDDGFPVEPRWYLPIIPMILVNGAVGIGTGFSTFVPQYNPIEIIERIQLLLQGKSVPDEDLIPWYRGFEGRITATEGGYSCIGKYEVNTTSLKIHELPVNSQISFNDYKLFLEGLEQGPTDGKKPTLLYEIVKDVQCDSSFGRVNINFKTRGLSELLGLGTEKMEKELYLRSKLPTTNMTLFDADENIKKYGTAQEIIDDFFVVRLQYYEKRLAAMIQLLEFQWKREIAKLRFVTDIMEDKIIIFKKRKAEIISILEKEGFPKFPVKFKAVGEMATVPDEESEPGEEEVENQAGANYEYLLRMRIDSFSVELIEKLKKERDDFLAQLEAMKQRSAQELWLEDLTNLKKAYGEWLGNWYKTMKIEPPKKINLGGIRVR